MNYCQVIKDDIANGPGIRLSLFVSGCENKCPGCFQPDTWDYDYGKPLTCEVIKSLIEEYEKPQYTGFTLLGGDPFAPNNINSTAKLLSEIRDKDFIINERDEVLTKDIWVYTGYIFEDLLEKADHNKSLKTALGYIDVLVDGPFIQSQKIPLAQAHQKPYRGSDNQRFIKSMKSIDENCIIEATEYYDLSTKT